MERKVELHILALITTTKSTSSPAISANTVAPIHIPFIIGKIDVITLPSNSYLFCQLWHQLPQ